MKKLFWFLLVFVAKPSDSLSFVATAINQIVRDFHVDRSVQFDLIVYGENKKLLSDLVNDIGKLISNENTPYKTIEVRQSKDVIEIHRSSILLFDTLESYQDFHTRAALGKVNAKQFFVLVYISNFDGTKMEIKQDLNGISRFESIISQRSKTSLQLTSFVTFQQPNCRKWKQVEINQFSMETRSWQSREFFREKFHNFNECELVIAILHDRPYCTNVTLDADGKSFNVIGYGPKLFEEIGKNLNFSIKYNPYDMKSNQWFNNSLGFDFFFQLVPLRLIFTNFKTLDHSHPITTTEELIIVSRSMPYTQFEKFFLPFDTETWICLAVTFSVATLVIFLLRWAREDVRDFTIGLGVQTPMVNLVNVWFGGGLTTCPGRNFARFTLMMFILFCLIMRTAYQGKQFEFMTKEVRRPDIQTIDDFIDENFTLNVYRLREVIKMYENMDFFKRMHVTELDRKELLNREMCTQFLFDGANRGYLLFDELFFHTYPNCTKLAQQILINHMVFSTPKNHFVFRPFNQKIIQLVESGIAEKFIKEATSKLLTSEESGPVVLTFEHLGIGFNIILCCLLISFICFLLELVAARYNSSFARH